METVKNRNPVLLIHGIFRKAGVFRTMATYLNQEGWQVWTPNLKSNLGEIGLDSLAEEVAAYIHQNFDPHQPIDLVGFSMGAIVSRYYLQRLGGIDRIGRFITISAPHHGTKMAHLLPGIGTEQMRPQSAFLQDLNRDAGRLRQVNFTSIWTPWDFIIVPANSSEMPEAENIQVRVFAHAMMVQDAQSLQAVAAALRQPLKPYRPPGHIPAPQKSLRDSDIT